MNFPLVVEAGEGTTKDYIYRANSMFEPVTYGNSHRPLGFDEWRALYEEYVVIGSKITVNVVSNFATAPTQYALITSTSGLLITDWLKAQEGVRAVSKFITAEGGSKDIIWLTNKFSARKWARGKVMSMDELECVGLEPPDEEYFFHFVTYNQSTSEGTYYASITIDYSVIWKEPRTLSQSGQTPPGRVLME